MASRFTHTIQCRHVLIFLVLVACLVTPAMAATKYFNGAPNLSATIAGSDQYTAGSEIQIPVIIENSGISTSYEVATDIVNLSDEPTTAKFVTVAMEPGDAPIVIESDPQMIGDIGSQAKATALISARVNADAAGGTYQVPINISYTQFSYVNQIGFETLQYYYLPYTVTINVPLVIKPEVIPEVLSATSSQLVAGSEGYVNLTIKNVGSLDGSKATIQIIQDNTSPVNPVDSSVYIGDFPAGSTVSTQYKVSVASDAVNNTYPVDVMVIYQDDEGDFVNSSVQTIGLEVGNKVNFTIVSPPLQMSPGSRNMVNVVYKNTGDTTIYSAEARLYIVDPFTSSSDIFYLGDLAPGQTAVATFQVSVASDATIKDYGLDSDIRYNDAIDDTYVSDLITVPVDVANLTGVQAIISSPLDITVIAAVIFGLILVLRRMIKKPR